MIRAALAQLTIRAADLTPASIDAEAHTVDVIAATGAAVRRRDAKGAFIERLDMTAAAFDPVALVGAPVLDTHQRDALDKVKGVVIAARLEGGRLLATLRIDDSALWPRVVAGVVRNISIGYEVESWAQGRDPQSGLRTLTATKWTPREVSFVPVPADPGAHTRKRTPHMEEEDILEPADAGNNGGGDPPDNAARAQTNAAIRTLATELNLSRSWADGQIDAAATVEHARTAALEALRTRAAPIRTATGQVGYSNDDPAVRAERMGEAIFARMNPAHALTEPARQFANMGTVDMARSCVRSAGLSTTGLSTDTLISRALTTADFPLALGNFTNRELRTAYDAAPSGLKAVARQTTAKDFRAKQKINVDTQATLEKVNEEGEFKFGGMIEGAESYAVDTYGKILSISRQVLINDDLGWTADMARRFGIEAAAFEANFLSTLLTSNSGAGPTMGDTVALFHATHGNLAASGAAISVSTLSAGRLAMRKQTGLGGRLISAQPRYLVVGAEKETEGETVLAALNPNTVAAVNVFQNKLTLVVEPRFTSTTRWYLAADPAQVEGLEYSYLQGSAGPQIETKAGFEVDGVMTKIRLDFGAGVVDWRGWFANPGA